ncbi:MAG: hypothetical protein V3T83_13970 [Acidobacteriota bacterium]
MNVSLVVTVDTEPDSQWDPPGQDGLLPPFAFRNTRGLGRLKDFLHHLEIPVTWMTSYAVARDRESAKVLREAQREGDEIGAHLHGWEAPPYSEVDRRHRPFIYEYGPDIRRAKHQSLADALSDAFGAVPFSYRAGRWGIDPLEYEHLAELGYGIDSSIPPGIDFRDRAGLRRLGLDFRSYLRSPPLQPYKVGKLWEVPASITPVGLLGGGRASVRMARAVGMHCRPSRLRRRCESALASTRLQKLVWVRPLKHPRADLVRGARALADRGASIINIMFHSSEAFAGTSPLSRTQDDVDRLYGDLKAVVATLQDHCRLRPLTLRRALETFTEGRL